MSDEVPKQGEIWMVDLNPTKGHEQRGSRPVLIVSNDRVAKYANLVQVAPISSTSRKYPLYLKIPDDNGTKIYGQVLTDQVRAMDYEARSMKKVGTLSDEAFVDKVLDTIQLIFSRN